MWVVRVSPTALISFAKARWALFALVLLYVYLTVHILSGSQGVTGWVDAEARADVLTQEVAALRLERARLTAEVESLATDSLELDVIDMRARERLFASREGELIIRRR